MILFFCIGGFPNKAFAMDKDIIRFDLNSMSRYYIYLILSFKDKKKEFLHAILMLHQ